MSVGNGTLRSEMKEILQNTYVMYAVLIIAILNIIGYLALRNMDAILFFILTFLLSIYFTRNMIIVLFISIIATNFYAGTSGMMSSSLGRKEGLKNKDKEGVHNKADADTPTTPVDEPDVAAATGMTEPEKTEPEKTEPEKPAEKTKDKPVVKTGMQNLKPAKFKPSKKANPDDEDDSNASASASKNKNKLAVDDEDEEDDDDDGYAKISGSKGNRVDYAQTLGQAYDNLQNIIGKDGVKGLTTQTKDLMEQQKVLMNNMKDMEPLIKSAQGFMDQIMGGGGLDGISKLFDGKLFGAIAPTIAANGKALQGKDLDEKE
jgi:hypothetical protein